jgi:hypothetical protein
LHVPEGFYSHRPICDRSHLACNGWASALCPGDPSGKRNKFGADKMERAPLRTRRGRPYSRFFPGTLTPERRAEYIWQSRARTAPNLKCEREDIYKYVPISYTPLALMNILMAEKTRLCASGRVSWKLTPLLAAVSRGERRRDRLVKDKTRRTLLLLPKRNIQY